MTLLQKSRIEAKKNGVRITPEVAKALKAVEAMHTLTKESGGSAYMVYTRKTSRER